MKLYPPGYQQAVRVIGLLFALPSVILVSVLAFAIAMPVFFKLTAVWVPLACLALFFGKIALVMLKADVSERYYINNGSLSSTDLKVSVPIRTGVRKQKMPFMFSDLPFGVVVVFRAPEGSLEVDAKALDRARKEADC